MGIEYVLQNFSDEEKVIIDRVIKEACHKLISNGG
jgi:peptidyl-tRNA hydrolase